MTTTLEGLTVETFMSKEEVTREDGKALRRTVAVDVEERKKLTATAQELAETAKRARTTETVKDVSMKLGVALWALGRDHEAVEALQEVKTRKEGAYFLGLCNLTLLRPDEAAECLRRAATPGEDFDVTVYLIEARRQKGEAQEAIRELEKLAEKHTTKPSLHYELGRCLDDLGEYESALNSYERALELDPNFTEAAFRLGFCNDLRGNDEDALKNYEKCYQQAALYPHAAINLGVTYERLGEYQKAIRCYLTVLASDPTNERAQLFLKDAKGALNMYYDEEKERLADRRSAVLDVPVTDFELSVRSRNCLEKMNIRTLGDLTRVTETQLLSFKNFGETSLNEIKQILASKGLRLGQAVEEDEQGLGQWPPSRAELEAFQPKAVSAGMEDLLARPIDDLHLTARGAKCMEKLNVRTLGDLAQKTEADLLGCKNFGQTSVDVVKEKLTKFGLKLREE
jgi:DNA-directed RNA polymerase subunit alpha